MIGNVAKMQICIIIDGCVPKETLRSLHNPLGAHSWHEVVSDWKVVSVPECLESYRLL